jgi:hypothetical protein
VGAHHDLQVAVAFERAHHIRLFRSFHRDLKEAARASGLLEQRPQHRAPFGFTPRQPLEALFHLIPEDEPEIQPLSLLCEDEGGGEEQSYCFPDAHGGATIVSEQSPVMPVGRILWSYPALVLASATHVIPLVWFGTFARRMGFTACRISFNIVTGEADVRMYFQPRGRRHAPLLLAGIGSPPRV